MTKRIAGERVAFDEEDAHLISEYTYYVQPCKKNKSGFMYREIKTVGEDGRRRIKRRAFIKDLLNTEDEQVRVVYIDGNSLNYCRSNLKVSSKRKEKAPLKEPKDDAPKEGAYEFIEEYGVSSIVINIGKDDSIPHIKEVFIAVLRSLMKTDE